MENNQLQLIEFELDKPIEELRAKMIGFNNEEILNFVNERLDLYKDKKYSESEIKKAKEDRATLNAFCEDINKRRIQVKKAWVEPYETFADKVKEITNLVETTIKNIDEQVKAYENAKKETKRQQIIDFWNNNIEELKDIVFLDKVFNDKWLNATTKNSAWQNDIIVIIGTIRNDLNVIDKMNFAQATHLKDYYLNCLNMSATLEEYKRLEEQERKLKDLENKNREQNTNKTQKVEIVNIDTEENLQQIDIRIWVTKQQKTELKQWLLQKGIKYGAVK